MYVPRNNVNLQYEDTNSHHEDTYFYHGKDNMLKGMYKRKQQTKNQE